MALPARVETECVESPRSCDLASRKSQRGRRRLAESQLRPQRPAALPSPPPAPQFRHIPRTARRLQRAFELQQEALHLRAAAIVADLAAAADNPGGRNDD